MYDEQWDRFVIYVNAYYAVEEVLDAARRSGEVPDAGLACFCCDANPFLWDGAASADEAVYEGFCAVFEERFHASSCTAKQGYALARCWLASLEGEAYGSGLVAAFDTTCDEFVFAQACDAVARQLQARASRLERTPQDYPVEVTEPEATSLTSAQIDAAIALLAQGDAAFAAELKARLDAGAQ